jgi:ABC-2 type transport system ATP-binding protein
MQVMLEANGLRVEFGPLVAVRDVTFSLRSGDLLGLVGPNGAGKTTLLRALCGLQSVSLGRVRIMGRDLLEDRELFRAQIGFAPDVPAVYEELTVDDFLDFITRSYRQSAARRAELIDFWLERLWLTEKRTARIATLSRGMRQRLTIARTLVADPSVILLDEPAGGLDPAGRIQFRRLLASLRDQGKALIVSSHILADLHEYCTHIAIMEHGSFLQFGSVAAVTGRDDGRCGFRMHLTRPTLAVHEALAGIDGVSHVEVSDREVSFEYFRDDERAAELLRRLVHAGLPILSFAPVRPDLEDAYLRSGVRQVD